MQRKLIVTKDGSHSISVPEMNVTYHSVYGAIQESRHLYIEAGLKSIRPLQAARCINIFEMGFGTGLNALLTLIEAEKQQLKIHYTAAEPYPLQPEEAAALNYCDQLTREDLKPVFQQLHEGEWEKDIAITPFFTLYKIKDNLVSLSTCLAGPNGLLWSRQAYQHFNLIYFDAFAPAAQPELWTREIFEKLFLMMKPGGILVTYCSKGNVRRAMEAAGFKVEKIPGPKGKREMIRAAHPKVI